MKKKISVIIAVVLIVTAISATAVFANDGRQNNRTAIQSMFDAMRSWSRQAVANGEITDEQANHFENHFNAMEKIHEDNGFGPCGSFGIGAGNDENARNGFDMGRGMMGSWSR